MAQTIHLPPQLIIILGETLNAGVSQDLLRHYLRRLCTLSGHSLTGISQSRWQPGAGVCPAETIRWGSNLPKFGLHITIPGNGVIGPRDCVKARASKSETSFGRVLQSIFVLSAMALRMSHYTGC